MAMGMSPDEFWTGDPYLCQSYSLAFSLRMETEDRIAWRHGMYVYDAVSKAIFNCFAGKEHEREQYLQKPLLTLQNENNKAREEEESLEARYHEAEVWMTNFFNGF